MNDARFEELLEAGLSGGMSLTWCRGLNIEEVGRRFGATVPGQWVTYEEFSEEYYDEEDIVLIAKVGDWHVAYEPLGFQGPRPEVASGLSKQGHALSVFWNVNMDTELTYAVGGRVLVSFDLLRPEERYGADPSVLDGKLHETGLISNDVHDVRKGALALGELVSGEGLTLQWLCGSHLMLRIDAPIPESIVPLGYLHPRMAFLDAPDFAGLLAGAPTVDLAPAIVRYLDEIAVRIGSDENSTEDVRRRLRQPDPMVAAKDGLDAIRQMSVKHIDDHRRLVVLQRLLSQIK
ncbi:DUF6461 domain-containing protein [Nonomuraea sp. NPDC005501]|uniref:DUF6461 domain-containing protein n=1 Tax=Nonomuraea sp. NPDC005501 TaxID=3156884 RepID=UPI0033A7CF3D